MFDVLEKGPPLYFLVRRAVEEYPKTTREIAVYLLQNRYVSIKDYVTAEITQTFSFQEYVRHIKESQKWIRHEDRVYALDSEKWKNFKKDIRNCEIILESEDVIFPIKIKDIEEIKKRKGINEYEVKCNGHKNTRVWFPKSSSENLEKIINSYTGEKTENITKTFYRSVD